MSLTTNFDEDIQKGKMGENIFEEDFLNFLNIKYVNVTECQQYQVIDADYLSQVGLYEIKTNYKDNKILIFEDYTNINTTLSPISYGWVYKSAADLIVFISKTTRIMVFLPFTQKFKEHYFSTITKKTELKHNKISVNGQKRWQSAFRCVSFELLKGFISVYKKMNNG